MRAGWRLAALLATAAALVLLRVAAREERAATPGLVRTDPPNSFFGVFVFGGFRPVFIEHLWNEADALSRQGRYWEVIEIFDRIARLDPGNPRVWFAQGYTIAFNVARKETEPAERWRLARRAVDHVQRGLERNPGDWSLMELRFFIFANLIAPDPYLDRQCRGNLGGDGLVMALEAADAMTRVHPEREAARDHLRRAGEEAAERMMNRGRIRDAALGLRELVRMGEETARLFPGDPADRRRIETDRLWAGALEDLDAAVDWGGLLAADGSALRDGEALARALAAAEGAWRQGRLVTDPEVELFDAAALALIHFKAMELAQSRILLGRPEDALPLLEWVRTMSRLTEARLGPRMPYYSEVYVDSMLRFLETDSALRQALATAPPPGAELVARWRRELEELDRIHRERTGRSDGFARRMVSDRGV